MVDPKSGMRQGLERSLLLGIVVLLLLLVVGELLSYFNVRQLNLDAEQVTHTYQVLDTLDEIESLAKDAERGHRGYIVTADQTYLEPYHSAVATIHGLLDKAHELTADNPQQQARIPKLRELVDSRLKTLQETLAARDSGGFEAAQQLISTDKGRDQMVALSKLVDEVEDEEQRLLKQRAERTKIAYRTNVVSGIVTAGLGILGIGAFGWLLMRNLGVRERAARALWEQRERYRTTLASIGDAVITTDRRGRVKFMNPIAESLTGWKEEEARDEPLASIMRIINEKTREAAVNPVDRVLAEGVIVGLANHTLLVRKDGVETPIDDSAAPIRNMEQKVTGCVLVFRDIVERKKAEAEIERLLANEKHRAERLKKLTDAALTLNSATTRDSVVGVVKAEAKLVFGAEQADVLMDGAALAPPERGLAVPLLARSGEPFGYLQLITKTDSEFTSDDRSILTQLAHMAAVAVQNAQLYEELRTANHRKNEFLATLAHELRNPLAPIRNSLELMQLSENDVALRQECRTIIERQVVQMVRLIDDLLDISRISRGKIELRKEHVDLQTIIAAAIEGSKPLIESQRHQLHLQLPAEPIMIHADPTRIAQIVLNLLNNAAKYTDPGGQIWLAVERMPKEVVIRVRDNGIGIPPDMLSHVFEMFTQVDRSLERSQGGLGIGLTLVRRMVEMHGGATEAHSEGEHQGSEFVVRLPLAAEITTTDAGALPSPAKMARAEFKRRILAVDDNQDAVDSLAIMLRLKGHEVQTAYDGMEAIDAVARFKPDIVLLDIGLPRLNGYDAARRIRKLPGGDRIKLIAITGWGQEEDRLRSQEAGFDFHLVKPVDPVALERLFIEAENGTTS